jgi:AraC-like DNA-binding protein
MSTLPNLNLNFWSILLLFGALQGFFFAITLAFHPKGNKTSNRLLSFLLFIFSLHLAEYVMVASGLYQQTPHFIGSTLPVVFLIGPIYYLYAVSLLQEEFHLDVKRALHFSPAVVCYLVLLPFYAQAPENKVAFLAYIIQSGFVIFPLDLFLLVALSTCQMLVYFYLTFNALNDYEESFKLESASTKIFNVDWLKKISLGFSLYMVLFFVAYFQLFLLKAHRQEIFYVVMLILSGFIHAVGYHAIRQPEIFSVAKAKPAAAVRPSPKYQKTALPEQKSQSYLEKLLQLMESKKPFLNPELKLSGLAEALEILPNHLSQVINAELNKSFFDFINEYRIEEAKRRLLDAKYEHYSILAIALDVGFNNKASFNRVFKKQTGMTPSDFVKTSSGKLRK